LASDSKCAVFWEVVCSIPVNWLYTTNSLHWTMVACIVFSELWKQAQGILCIVGPCLVESQQQILIYR